MSRECIIYKITNIKTSQIYIGSSIDIKERIRRHFKDLKANKHHSLKMQRSYNKYGRDVFKITYLCKFPEEYRQKMEQWFLDNNDCYFNNELIVGKPQLNRDFSEEYRKNCSNRMMGNEFWKLTPPMSEENKLKVAECARNRIWTNEMRKKLSDSVKKSYHLRPPRKPHTDKTKLKMSKSSQNKRVITQCDLNENILKIWGSINEIVDVLGFEQASISRCCQEKQKTSYGFIFKYF